MAYDAYGRPLREPDYYDPQNTSPAGDYTNRGHQNYYESSEPRPSNTSYQNFHRESPHPRRRESPPVPLSGNMSSTDRGEQTPVGPEVVSPELIAAITEKVKKELFEQLKQSGNVELPSQAPPMQRQPSNKSSSTPSPPPTSRKVYTPPSPTQTGRQTYAQTFAPPPMEPMRSHPGSPLEEPLGGNRFADRGPAQPSSPDKPSGVRFSDRGAASRPAAGNRTYSTIDLSTIDQKWGRLFEKDGKPTQRLGQFLRGLANHIIECFPVKKSIVVTPSKMAAYYAAHALEKEPHPLLTIFRAQSNEHISQLYQDIGCEHHLVQEDSHSAPTIPALTPVGFAHWMTINILAYPQEESERLAKVVIAMPIDADGDLVDGKPERLPKQISRHLLPDREDRSSRKLLDSAIESFLDDLGSTSRRKASITSPGLSRHSSLTARPRSDSSATRGVSTSSQRSYGATPVEIHQTRNSPTTAKAQPIERERNPYSGAPSNASETSEEGVKIERERQPYSAQPGSGKNHIENLNPPQSRSARANSTSSRISARDQPDQENSCHVRTNSNASQNKYPPRAGTRRSSSPPFRNFSQSTPDEINNSSKYGPNPSASQSSFTTIPSTYNTTHRGSEPTFPPPPSGAPPVDNRRRERDERQYRRGGMEDESRFTGEFNSPRDAEKWDRYQDAAKGEDRFPAYERGSVSVDPRDRGAPAEDWYRDRGRGSDYDGATRRY